LTSWVTISISRRILVYGDVERYVYDVIMTTHMCVCVCVCVAVMNFSKFWSNWRHFRKIRHEYI